jgi:WD40 repeat protein
MAKDTCVNGGLKSWSVACIILVVAILYPAGIRAQFYNGSQMAFGKSRVQYSDFLWLYFRFEKFDTYYYLNGRELALYTAEYADKHIKEIELDLQSNLEEKVQFIIFNTLSDLKQSNVGLFGDWDYYNTGGVTRIIGGRVLLFFDGNYEHFDRQIRAGIAQVILNNMMYGTGIGAQIKNNALFSVPEWYVNGIVSFISRKWDAEIENQVRDAILNGKYDKFNGLSGEEATYAGHSLWNYIALKYGSSSIPNIVYMARLSRNVEKGFQYVLGKSFKLVIQEWLAFYKEVYNAQKINRTEPQGEVVNKRNKPDRIYNSLKIDPAGGKIAYATHSLGIYKVFIQDQETGKKRRVYRGGYRLADRPDYSYPLIAWHPSGRILAFLVERKGEIWLYFYNLDDKSLEHQILVNFQKVLDLSYSDDGTLLVLSAVQKGQSDIFVYNIGSGSHEQITKDRFDDMNPRFINHSRDIIFSSNRTNDTIRFDEPVKIDSLHYNNDLFLYHYSSKTNILQHLTKTPDAHETQPLPYDGNYFCFLSDQNGMVNRYLARYDSAISYIDTITHYRYFTTTYPVTNYSSNIVEQDVSPRAARMGEIIFKDRNYKMITADLVRPKHLAKMEVQPSYFRELRKTGGKKLPDSVKTDTTLRLTEPFAVKANRHFRVVRQSEVVSQILARIDSTKGNFMPDKGQAGGGKDTTSNSLLSLYRALWQKDLLHAGTGKDTTDKYKNAKQLNYNVEYYIDQMVTQIDFTYLNYAYQPFTGSSAPVFVNPGLNALFMVGVTDLMEDYRISGGIRLNVNLINNEYLFSFGNYKHRIDHQIVFHRKAVEETGYYSTVRHKIHELYYIATYPFTPVLNIKGTASVRYDRAVYLSTDAVNLQQPDIHKVWGSLKGELTYDNTRSLGLNLYQGTRYKLFGEYYQLINTAGNNMVVVGMDIRNYQKLHRSLIWANRFAASTSFGSNKLLYYMGGVDNWLFPTYNYDIPVATDQNYAFQTLSTNMRGFNQNIRNGNSFFVLNSEMRWPVFRYLFNRPIRSDFINNFQLVAFGDVGTAWTGSSPWASNNQLFIRYIESNPLFVKVEMQIDPIVEGFGFGARTRLFGYFLRGDLAWGVEDGRIKKPVFYFSLSLDF